MIEYENLNKTNKKFFNSFQAELKTFLDKGRFVLGNGVETFERDFARYCGVDYCVGVGNGLDALTLSLIALDLPPKSEVIVPSNTYIATILAVLHAGHIPVLAEPDLRTYNINPEEIKKKLTKKTKAILVVHLYGKICAMDEIEKIAKENGLFLLEDCAQSHGAKLNKKKAGTFGDISAFSFYPTKNLGAIGDAGAVVTNNKSLREKLLTLRNYGSSIKYYNEIVGYNSRLDELQALFLKIKLQYLDEINEHKRKLASLYLDNLKEDFIKPIIQSGYYDVYHIFNIRHVKRNELREYLLKNNIITEIHYPVPPHQQNALKDMLPHSFPLSEEIHKTTLSLPISFCNTEADIMNVIEIMNKF